MAVVTDMNQQGAEPTALDDYFALKTGSELIEACFDRVDKYHRHVESTGKLSTWKRTYKNYYLGGIEHARLQTAGEQLP